MAEMKISNTLVNDTSSGEIAYAEQLKDRQVNWNDPSYDKIPQEFKTNASKFQGKLNDFFLKHYNAFQTFLTDKGVDGVIDTWRDVEEFLENISDSEAITLMKLIGDIEEAAGHLNIRMSAEVPGLMEAVTRSDTPVITKSHLDSETGAINIIYTFE